MLKKDRMKRERTVERVWGEKGRGVNKPPSTRLKKIDALKKIRQHNQKRVLPSAAVSEGHRPVHFLPLDAFQRGKG